MTTYAQMEQGIDKRQTVKQMRKELKQLYYYVNAAQTDLQIEDNAAAYLSYTSSVIHTSKKNNHPTSDTNILKAIEKKDNAIHQQQIIAAQQTEITNRLLQGIALLSDKEKQIIEAVYIRHEDKTLLCYHLGITDSTLRRRLQEAIYHLAILLHKTVPNKKLRKSQ